MIKNFYSKYNADGSWLIEEKDWVRSLQGVRESQFALGNGFLGSRGILEEIPYDASPGTYLAGIYDKIGSQVSELVNLPNPFNFKVTVRGEKIGAGSMNILKHERILNMQRGLLSRRTIYRDSKKRRYDYQSIRFVSMHDKNIGVMQIILTPIDDKARLSIHTGIDTSVHNAGIVTEGRKKHFRIKEVGQADNAGYLAIETFEKSYSVIYRSGFYFQTKNKKVFAKDNIFEFKLEKKQTIVFTKIFYINHISSDEDFNKIKKLSEKKFKKAFRCSFDILVKKHINAWEGLWKIAGISIRNESDEIEKNLRFNIYHMLICAKDNEGFSSIGARTLSGEGYRGHIFWDTETFLLPFYIYTFPNIARSLLLYRYKRLDEARRKAKGLKYKGAMFPWESAASGKEETPGWAKDLDGQIIKIHTGKKEHHITADIAFAFYHYYLVTGDEKFMEDFGYEVLFETARFWASRVEYNKKKHKYEIKHVIGPDEFHKDINNNAFTNMMAKWNLLIASRMFNKIKKAKSKVYSRLAAKLKIGINEVKKWEQITPRICMTVRKDKVIEQFDGFFRKKKIKIDKFNRNSMPLLPKGIKVKHYANTQLVKQADVLMLVYFLSDIFSHESKKRNYYYYIDRTLHKSSLSPSIHALTGLGVGDFNRAYQYFNMSLHTDISNIHGNTCEGIHAACLGGVWQVVVNGFAGVRIERGILSINPRVPKNWRKMLFSLNWRGNILTLEITNARIKIKVSQGEKNSYPAKPRSKQARLKVRIFGILRELKRNRKHTFERKVSKSQVQRYY